ncbi:MAG: flagellar biosynthesis anti-sigma factor FlgM [Paraperlucidibaca sp.]
MVDNISAMPTRRPELVRNEATKHSDPATKSNATSGMASAQGRSNTSATSHMAGASNTSASSLIERAKAAAEQVPEVDRQKVDDIKLAIARGEFHVNPKAVAQAFVSMTLNATR